MFTWQWWVSQGFALIGLVCLVASMQQKGRVKILSWNLCAACAMFTSCCFLWKFSAMILMGVSSVRSVTALLFAMYPKTNRWIFLITNVVLGSAIIALNVIFWQGWLSILSIIIGIGFILAFAQTKPKNIRRTIAPVRLISTTYYCFLLAPINAVIEITAFVSTAIGMIRYDRKTRLQKDEK
ncbi:MAG: YgjV family protein [Christensenellaceae bacterium]|jgi:hypothetical protein|nr:YgjV family protein [Christensenellaceae bacterium]